MYSQMYATFRVSFRIIPSLSFLSVNVFFSFLFKNSFVRHRIFWMDELYCWPELILLGVCLLSLICQVRTQSLHLYSCSRNVSCARLELVDTFAQLQLLFPQMFFLLLFLSFQYPHPEHFTIMIVFYRIALSTSIFKNQVYLFNFICEYFACMHMCLVLEEVLASLEQESWMVVNHGVAGTQAQVLCRSSQFSKPLSHLSSPCSSSSRLEYISRYGFQFLISLFSEVFVLLDFSSL